MPFSEGSARLKKRCHKVTFFRCSHFISFIVPVFNCSTHIYCSFIYNTPQGCDALQGGVGEKEQKNKYIMLKQLAIHRWPISDKSEIRARLHSMLLVVAIDDVVTAIRKTITSVA